MAARAIMNRVLLATLKRGAWVAALVFPLGNPAAWAEEQSRSGDQFDFFEQKIRPVLDTHCYACHSDRAEKAGKLKGGLKLDTAAATRQGGDSGPAVVPGDVANSLLIGALRHESFEMPPDGKLDPQVIENFVHWVEAGAPDPRDAAAVSPAAAKEIDFSTARRGHWAFQPPQAVPPPAVSDESWPLGDIDRFVLAKLDAERMRPVQAAPARDWLRRVHIVLTGLPPTAEEVEAFERDDSPACRAQVVDRLLATTAYAERWARHWLDIARYSEDQALAIPQANEHAYRYRDWVIRAMRDDMPYDRFITLQLAGDLVEEPVDDHLLQFAGLGFQGLGQLFHRGNFPEQVMADELDDRVDVIGRGLLGLTVSCARCHDHKFDPIPTRDYYSLAAAYFGSELYERATAPASVTEPYERFLEEEKKRVAAAAESAADLKERVARAAVQNPQPLLESAWLLHARRVHKLPVDAAAMAAERKLPPYFLERWATILASDSVSDALKELRPWHRVCRAAATAAHGEQTARAGEIPDDVAAATRELARSVAGLFAELDRVRSGREQALAAVVPSDAGKDAAKKAAQNVVSAEWREWETSLLKDAAAPLFIGDEALAALIDGESRKRHEEIQAELAAFRKAAPPAPPLTHSIRGGGKPMPVYVRGSVDRKGELAPPGFLRILRTEASSPAGDGLAASAPFTRLDLAKAITSRDNPLTARVIVNRVWQHHFGRGLVATPSNFGALGDPPSHPELLDFLAVAFMDHGWSLKWLHRQIVLARVYQLASTAEPENTRRDPENQWLWRWAPRRLDFEAWRDSILSVSGLLDRREGGPSQPVDDHVRRTIYSKVCRSKLDPTLVVFDFPDANVTSEKRALTIVAQQQLYAMNGALVTKAAKAFAARIEASAANDDDRIAAAYRLAYSRGVEPREREWLLHFLSSASADPANRLTPWERVAQTLLVANEMTWLP